MTAHADECSVLAVSEVTGRTNHDNGKVQLYDELKNGADHIAQALASIDDERVQLLPDEIFADDSWAS